MHKPGEGSSATKSFASTIELAHCQTGIYNVLCVGPRKTGDGRQVGPKLLWLEIRIDEPGRGINTRVVGTQVQEIILSPRGRNCTEIVCHGL